MTGIDYNILKSVKQDLKKGFISVKVNNANSAAQIHYKEYFLIADHL